MIRVCHIAVGRIAFLAVFLFAVANCPAGDILCAASVGAGFPFGSGLRDRAGNADPDRLAGLLLNHRVLWLGDRIAQDGKYAAFDQSVVDLQAPADKLRR